MLLLSRRELIYFVVKLLLLGPAIGVEALPPAVLRATLSTRTVGLIHKDSETRTFFDVGIWGLDFDQPLFTYAAPVYGSTVFSRSPSPTALPNSSSPSPERVAASTPQYRQNDVLQGDKPVLHMRSNDSSARQQLVSIHMASSAGSKKIYPLSSLNGLLRLKCGHTIIESLPYKQIKHASTALDGARSLRNTLVVLPGELPTEGYESEVLPQILASVDARSLSQNSLRAVLVRRRGVGGGRGGGAGNRGSVEDLQIHNLHKCKLRLLQPVDVSQNSRNEPPELVNAGGERVREEVLSVAILPEPSVHSFYDAERVLGTTVPVESAGSARSVSDNASVPIENITGAGGGEGAHARELIDRSSMFSFVQVLHSVSHYEKLEASQYFELIEDPLQAILKPAIVSILVSILKSILLSIFAQLVPPIIAMVMICPIQKFMFMGQPCNPEGTRPDPDMPDMPDLPPIPGMPTGHGGPNSPGDRPMPTGNSRHEDAPPKDDGDNTPSAENDRPEGEGTSHQHGKGEDENGEDKDVEDDAKEDNNLAENNENDGNSDGPSPKSKVTETIGDEISKGSSIAKRTAHSTMTAADGHSIVLPSIYLRAEADDHKDQLEYTQSVLDTFAPASKDSVTGLRNEVLLHTEALDATRKALRLAMRAEECERENKCVEEAIKKNFSNGTVYKAMGNGTISAKKGRVASAARQMIDGAAGMTGVMNDFSIAHSLSETVPKGVLSATRENSEEYKAMDEIHNLSTADPALGVISRPSRTAGDILSRKRQEIAALRKAESAHSEAISMAMIELRENLYRSRGSNAKDSPTDDNAAIDKRCAEATEPKGCQAVSILVGNENNFCVWVMHAPQSPSSLCTSVNRIAFKLGSNGLWREDEKSANAATDDFKIAAAIQGSALVTKMRFDPFPPVGKFGWATQKLADMAPPAKKESPNPENIVELVHMATAAIVDKTYAPLERNLYANLVRDINATVARVAGRSLTQSITAQVTTELTQRLAATLRGTVARVTTKKVLRALTPSLTQTLTGTLAQAVTRSPKSDYYCSLCRQHKLYCSMCYESISNDSAKEYYSSYYAEYFSAYYSFAYASSLSDNFVVSELAEADKPMEKAKASRL